MNLFVVGSGRGGTISPGLAQGALEEVAGRIPRLRDQPSEGWSAPDGSAVAACLAHDPADLGGVRYRAFLPDAMAVYAGRPIAWQGDADADGRGPLDPEHYLGPAGDWRPALDGRYAVARWTSDDGLEVFTDPLARFPVYLLETGDASWASNCALALALLAGDTAASPEVLAHFFACGWSLTGDPLWSAVRSVERGTRVSLRDGAVERTQDQLPDAELPGLFGAEGSDAAASELIVAAARALVDWPGRGVQLGLSGGYDSRLILAAALRAGLDFEIVTKALPNLPGYPETPDVRFARDLCERVGLRQTILDPGPEGGLFANLERAVELLRATGPGTVALADSHELPLAEPGPPPLLVSGLGAERAKTDYQLGLDEPADAFAEHMLDHHSPTPPARLVNDEAEAEVKAWIRAWSERQSAAGVPPRQRAPLFMLLVRAGLWGAAGLVSRDFAFDTVQPAGTLRLLGHQMSVPQGDRLGNEWHLRVTKDLAPRVVSMPYEPMRKSLRVRVALEARRRAALEARRLLRRPRSAISESFAHAVRTTAEAVAGQPGHAAWAVLDRGRVERLLRRDPDRLDPRSRAQVLRLATVFVET